MARAAELSSNGSGGEEPRQRVIEAAIRCFEQFGAQRTSMADIAEAAGMSRKTLYRVFEDRPTLIEHVLLRRMQDQSAKIRRRLSREQEFRGAIVEGSIVSIASARADRMLSEIVQNETTHRLDQFLLRGNREILQGMSQIWVPVIEKGRAQGQVREDLSNERIVEIIMSMHALLFMRDDYGPARQRAFLEDVLVPAITGKA